MQKTNMCLDKTKACINITRAEHLSKISIEHFLDDILLIKDRQEGWECVNV